MKATKVLSLLALGLLVTSCGGNSNTSSTSSSSSSSSSSISTSSSTSSVISSSSSSSSLTTSTSSSSSSVTGPSLKEFILSSVAKLKEGNFSLTYEINNVNFTDVITKNYFYTAYLNTGSMLLETYSTTKYAYNFEITSENKVNVKGQTFNDELTGQELASLDYVNKFKDFDTTREIEFSGDNNEIYTTDEVLVEAFASQLDFTGIKRLRFYTAADELVVELQGFDSSKNDYYTPETGAIVFIENIGTSKLDAVEDYLNSYVVPTETLDNKADNLFGNVSFTSAIYDNIFLDEYTSIERQGFSNLDIYDDYFRITDINEDNVSTSYTYEKIDEDGTLIITGVNGKNEVEEERTTIVVDDFNFVNKDGFELSKFRKFEGDEYYTYLGSNASDLAYSITQHKKFLEWPVESIKVKVEDGKVTQLIFSTGIMMDRLTGYYFYRYADSRVAATPNVITGAEKKVASENDAQIKSYLSYLNQEDSVFTSIEKDSAWGESRFTKIVKGSDFYLKGTYLVDSDDGELSDSITFNVVASTVTSFTADFDSSVETIVSNKNTFYKLELGQSYPLTVSFNSTDEADNVLEASFSVDGCCSFDSSTNTLTPLKKTGSVVLTLKVKGTNLKKEYYLKVVNPGEKDVSEVIAKLDSSIEKEKKLTVNTYDVNLHFNTLDINDNRTDAVQSTKFKIYKDTTDRYMVGDTDTSVTYTPYGSSESYDSTSTSHLFKGMSDDGNYYEFQVYDNGQHIVAPSKKAIVESVSDSKTQITREKAIKQSTTLIMNSHEGLSDIAKMHFNGLYENSIGYGSVPLYFGGGAASNLKIVEKDNVVIADTFFIEAYPTSVTLGEVYYNHGEYTFNTDGVLTSIKVVSNVYDNTMFDFTEKKLLQENPVAKEMYMTEYKQTFGSLNTQEVNEYDPDNLYFTSYTPVFADKKGYEAKKYEIGETYYISYLDQAPKFADSRIDSLIIDETSNPDVASITDEGRSIKIEGAGVAVLTVYSLKNRVKREITVNVDTVLPTAITAKVGDKVVTEELETTVGTSIDNLTFAVSPSTASQEVNVTLEGVGNLTKKADGSYSFVSDKEGKATITVTSTLYDKVSTTLTINVAKKQETSTIVDTMLKTTYSCYEDSFLDSEDVASVELTFTSRTQAKFVVEDLTGLKYIVNCDVVIDEANNTITFTSFNVTNEDYDYYIRSYMPVIKQNVVYDINKDGSFTANIVTVEDNVEYDFATGNESPLTTFIFEAKK